MSLLQYCSKCSPRRRALEPPTITIATIRLHTTRHEFVVVTDIQISWARAFMLTLQFGLSGCLILFLYRLLWHIIDLMLVVPAAVIMKP